MGLPKWSAELVTLSLVLSLLALMGVVLIIPVQTMVRAANEYSNQVVHLIEQLFARLDSWKIRIDQARFSQELKSLLPGLIAQTVGTMTAIISHGFPIVFFVIFLLVGQNLRQQRADIYAELDSLMAVA